MTGSQADLFLLPIQSISLLKGTTALMSLSRIPVDGLEQGLFSFPPGMRNRLRGGAGTESASRSQPTSLSFSHNNTLMQSVGLPPLAQLGETWHWHDMIEVGRRVSLPEQRRYLVDVNFEFVAVYFLAHGDVIGPDGKPNLLSEFNAELLDLARRAINEDRISPPLTQQNDATGRFRRGMLGMRQESLSDLLPGALGREWLQTNFEWDVVPLPLSPYTFRRPAFGEGSGLVAAQGAPVTLGLRKLFGVGRFDRRAASSDAFGPRLSGSPLLWDQAMFYASGPPRESRRLCPGDPGVDVFCFSPSGRGQPRSSRWTVGCDSLGRSRPRAGLEIDRSRV